MLTALSDGIANSGCAMVSSQRGAGAMGAGAVDTSSGVVSDAIWAVGFISKVQTLATNIAAMGAGISGLQAPTRRSHQMKIQDRVAIVTGCGRERGIGRAIAVRLAKGGAHILAGEYGRSVKEYPDAKFGQMEELE